MQISPIAGSATTPADHVPMTTPTTPHVAASAVSDPDHDGDSDSGAAGAKDADGGAQTAKSLVNVKL
jgi:hypothetical protein